jgi:DNA-binding transcriptional ArsR family regulator
MSIQALNWARQVGAQGVLRPAEVLLLWMLADHADEAWSCHPSQQKLAKDSNQSKRTVTSQIGRLRELGLISVENRYGQGRGRIGVRYYLHEEALKGLMDRAVDDSGAKSACRTNKPDAGPAAREMAREADVAPESTIGETPRKEDSAPESLSRNSTHDSDANPGPVRLKERARINPHQNPHHPGSVRQAVPPTPPKAAATDHHDDDDDEDNDLRIHRGVSLPQLGELVPDLAQIEPEYVPGLVDVVLNRATARVASPTRYVATALRADFEGILDAAAQRWLAPHPAPGIGPRALPPGTAPAAPKRPTVPAVPCTNPDHHEIYNRADCPQCRLESRLAPPTPDQHVEHLSAEQIETLPASLRRRIGA